MTQRQAGPAVLLTFLLVLPGATGCGKSEPGAVAARPGQLLHTEISAARLAPPYATPSASNFSSVVSDLSGALLTVPPRFQMSVWSEGPFQQPRMMALAPNGDVFVADTEGGEIVVLRDVDGKGKAGKRWTFAAGLRQPFGMALHGRYLYVGDTDAVLRFPYRSGQTAAEGPPERIATLPAGGHSTRNLLFSADGTRLYVSEGSASNDNSGEPPSRAAISMMDPEGKQRRVFASGMRNPIGLALNPLNGELWTAVNERDGLGDDLPPDYATSVRDGDFFGWPFAYIGRHADPRFKGVHPELVARSRVPDVLIQAHSAPIGLTFYDGKMFPAEFRGSALVALHGSWNRSQLTGYKVIRIPFRDGHPAGGYDDFIVGWSPDPSRPRVWGRPAGLLVLGDGSLLVTDDAAAKIWRVTYR
jgi:glucose/arabinose dehydrogenase